MTRIYNREILETSLNRRLVLDLIEAGLSAIDTGDAIRRAISLKGDILDINGTTFDLKRFRRLFVIAVGKNAAPTAVVLEEILGDRIADGLAIGLEAPDCRRIVTRHGTHPLPSATNVKLSEDLVRLAKRMTENDLVLTAISGGGSSLLVWPESELKQGERLYNEFLKTGGTITEMNTVRKHISGLKGGGLAKLLHPATVVGLIFSDIPGDHATDVASGPTYRDSTTVADAQAVLNRYGLGGYDLKETPKEDEYFRKVTNLPIVSNLEALDAMEAKAKELGLKVKRLSSELYDSPDEIAAKLACAAKDSGPGTVILAAGEPSVTVTVDGGSGGRCQRTCLAMLRHLTPNLTFAAVASDGLDNGPASGAIIDMTTKKGAKSIGLDPNDHWKRFDGFTFFDALGRELLMTGPTGSNVSDLFVGYKT